MLLVDADIVFLRNPLKYISLQGNYDIAIQDDTVEVGECWMKVCIESIQLVLKLEHRK